MTEIFKNPARSNVNPSSTFKCTIYHIHKTTDSLNKVNHILQKSGKFYLFLFSIVDGRVTP